MTAVHRRWLWAIVGVGAVLRLGWAVLVRPDPPTGFFLAGDQFSYYFYGRQIAEGGGYLSYVDGAATAYYPIGYPALLGALYFVILHTPIVDDLLLATALLHVVVASASILLLFVVTRALAGARAGLVAAGIFAVHPNMVFQVSTVQLETVFVFLVLVCLALIVTHDWAAGPPSNRRLVAFGVALGGTILVRPFAAVLLVGVAAALLVIRVGWRRLLGSLALVVGIVVALSIPWTVRNAIALDAFVPSSTNMGDTLCLDRNLDATGGFRYSEHDGCVDPSLPEVPRNRGNTRKAIEFVIEHPERELLQILRRGRIMLATDHDAIEAIQVLSSDPPLSDLAAERWSRVGDAYFRPLLVLSAIGLPLFAVRRRRPQRLIVLSGLVGLLVIPLLLWGNPRFHLPLAPFLALSAALAVDASWTRLDARRA